RGHNDADDDEAKGGNIAKRELRGSKDASPEQSRQERLEEEAPSGKYAASDQTALRTSETRDWPQVPQKRSPGSTAVWQLGHSVTWAAGSSSCTALRNSLIPTPSDLPASASLPAPNRINARNRTM